MARDLARKREYDRKYNSDPRNKARAHRLYMEKRGARLAAKVRRNLDNFKLSEKYLLETLEKPCRFCGNEFLIKTITNEIRLDWAFDHDHTTGQFRGIIHNKCNVGLGLLGDTRECLLRGAEYFDNLYISNSASNLV